MKDDVFPTVGRWTRAQHDGLYVANFEQRNSSSKHERHTVYRTDSCSAAIDVSCYFRIRNLI